MRYSCRFFCAALLLAWLAVVNASVSSAQSEPPETCAALTAAAFSQAASLCGDLQRDTACYADGVTATFDAQNGGSSQDQPQLEQPGDTAATVSLENFITSGPDLPQSTLGFGILSIQGDLPVSLSQSVRMVLIGAAEVENGVLPARAIQLPDAPLEVRVTSETSLHNIPDSDAPVVGQVSADTVLQADGMTANSLWLRVYFPSASRVTAWVSRSWLEPNLDTTGLSIITPDSHSPMQRFFLSTASAAPESSPCADAADALLLPPSLLLVQGPSGTQIRLTVNEVDLSTEATMVMQSDAENGLRLFALDGDVRLFPDTPEELTLQPGSFVTFCQEGGLDLGIDDDADDFRVSRECAAGGIVQQCSRANLAGLDRLSLLPMAVLNRPVVLPPQCFGEGVSASADAPEFVEICVRAGGIGSAECVPMVVRYRPDLIDPQTGQPVVVLQTSPDVDGDESLSEGAGD